MNADRTIYGRYGTRSSVQEAAKDVSVAGLAESMAAAWELHQKYPGNKKSLAGKQPVEMKYKTPDDFPSLRGKFLKDLDYAGAVTKSCMHCHQVRDAERQIYRNAGQPIPDRLLFPNPLPATIGLTLDPRRRASVLAVALGSAARNAGIKTGDEIIELDGQAIVSPADVQWVLHNADDSAELAVTVDRDGRQQQLTLELVEDWRRNSDISWRVTSWPLRRMGTGGLLFEPTSAEQRRKIGVDVAELALSVKHVGQYGAHAAAKKAGFKKGDIVVSFDGRTKAMSTSQLLAYTAQETKPGQEIPVVVMRGNRRLELKLPMQK